MGQRGRNIGDHSKKSSKARIEKYTVAYCLNAKLTNLEEGGNDQKLTPAVLCWCSNWNGEKSKLEKPHGLRH